MKKKPIFIHIPKAGGTSIGEIVKKYNNELPPCLHCSVNYYSKEYRDACFVFSFVRNPYDRLLSAHAYLTGGLGNNGDTKFGKTLSPDFKYFVRNQLNNNLNWLHFKPIKFWLNDDIDYIGRMENYENDFRTICDKIGIPRQKLPHNNKTNHTHYTEYYDDETRKIVAEKYAKDFEHFGYEFGE
jgi:chondroitin 4-sulfotransferase 11